MMRDHNYQELVRKVTMYLDNELTESAEMELLKEIKANPAYLEILSKEQSFREFIKSKIHRRKPSPALVQSIKEKIRIAPAWVSRQILIFTNHGSVSVVEFVNSRGILLWLSILCQFFNWLRVLLLKSRNKVVGLRCNFLFLE